jgi:translocator protein
MNRAKLRQWINVLAYLLTLIVNGLANALPLNGQNTGQISDRFAVFFTPAGYVFAIWGVIYILLGIFTVYQALPAQRANPRLGRIGYLFALSSLANVAWIFLWHYNLFYLTLLAMGTLLVSLIAIYLRLDPERGRAGAAERWALEIPFSVYLGWITVATIANVTDVLYLLGWHGGPAWALPLLAVGVALAAALTYTRRDAAYDLVLAWAFIGIAVRQAATPLVVVSAYVAAGLAAILALWALLRPRRRAA